MKTFWGKLLLVFSFCSNLLFPQEDEIFIRLNQAGFLPDDIKTAVVFSNVPVNDILYYIRDAEGLQEEFSGRIISSSLQTLNFNYAYTIEFSSFTVPGRYILEVDGFRSYPFLISETVYNHIADSLALFFRAQRCGPTQPYLHQPCHLSDVTEIIGDSSLQKADLTGGWHDAADYIKFLLTSSYTTYMLIFAYEFDEIKFGFDNDNNSVPDILEEAKVGLDWLLRAHYKNGGLITQVQDLRDHTPKWRMPEEDSLQFDRPGYTGMGKNQAGMFIAALSLGARVWEKRFLDSHFAEKCLDAAYNIYSIRDSIPDLDSSITGAYQDKDFTGKMALAAAELFLTTGNLKFLEDAKLYISQTKPEFWWSWGNVNASAFYRVASVEPEYLTSLQVNLDYFDAEKEKSLFSEGTKYSWGTTASFLGVALQAILYKKLTGSSRYDTLATKQRDFVLGRNKWGLSFIHGIGTSYPEKLHSQLYYLNGGILPGALTAGPSPAGLFSKYQLSLNDRKYERFNSPDASYYDDTENYITNESAISSNATALFVFGCYSRR